MAEIESVSKQFLNAIYILDVSVLFLMAVLAHLSKKIGEALNVPRFYHYYYTCCAMLTFLVIADMALPHFMLDTDKGDIATVTMALRAMLVLSTLPVTMIYWHWLFSENLKK